MAKAYFAWKPNNAMNDLKKPKNANMQEYIIEATVKVPDNDFAEFSKHLLRDQGFIKEHKEKMYCKDRIMHVISVISPNSPFSILVEAEGYGYARYAAFLSHGEAAMLKAKAMVKEVMEKAKENQYTIKIPVFANKKFETGRLIVTMGIAADIKIPEVNAALLRHVNGDWGCIPKEDAISNDESIKGGGRILSAYYSNKGLIFWIITETDRSVTTVLLPSEY